MSTWIIIFTLLALAVVVFAALTVPVYLKFSISSERNAFTVSYGGICVLRFGGASGVGGKEKFTKKEKAHTKTDEEKLDLASRLEAWATTYTEKLGRFKKWAGLAPQISGAVANLIWRILRNIKIENLRGEIGGGFCDPALTGMLVGWSSAILGALPALGKNILIKPDFDAEEIRYDASGQIRLSPLRVAGSFLRFLIEAPLFRIIKLTLTRG